MTMDEVELALDADPEKVRLFEEALNGKAREEAKNDAEAFSVAAKAAGLDITPEEVERHFVESLVVDEEDLERVSGGVKIFGEAPDGHDNWCGSIYYCYVVTLHSTEDENWNEGTTCWSDHHCMTSEHAYCGSGFVRCWSDQN